LHLFLKSSLQVFEFLECVGRSVSKFFFLCLLLVQAGWFRECKKARIR
jgi:hypothetical protein